MFTRLLDQTAWSGAFFLFNLAASLSMSVDSYAFFAVVSSIAFIGVSVARNVGVNSRVVAGARNETAPATAISLKYGVLAYGMVGFVAVLAFVVADCFPTSESGDSSAILGLALYAIGFFIIQSDLPRQLLIFGSEYRWSLLLSCIYLVSGCVGLVLWFFMRSTSAVLSVWLLALLLVAVFGVFRYKLRVGSPGVDKNLRANAFAWRMGVEALYIGLGSQASVLLLFFAHNPTATEGIRLGYSLVFSPAFMVFQALVPLYIQRLANAYLSSEAVDTKLVWLAVFGCIGVFGLSAIVAKLVSDIFPSYRGLSSAMNYLVPVGLSVLSNQIIELAVAGGRFAWRPQNTLRLRFFVVGIDLCTQITAVVVGGVSALVGSMVVLSVFRFLIALLLIRSVSSSWLPWVRDPQAVGSSR